MNEEERKFLKSDELFNVDDVLTMIDEYFPILEEEYDDLKKSIGKINVVLEVAFGLLRQLFLHVKKIHEMADKMVEVFEEEEEEGRKDDDDGGYFT